MGKKICRIWVVLFLFYVLVAGCSQKVETKVPQQPYRVGVIDSVNYGAGTTYIHLMDENLKETEVLESPYHALGSFGSAPVQVLDGMVYEKSVGDINKYNKCAVTAMDMKTGEWKDYPYKGEGGLQDFRINENGLFMLGNINYDTYVDYHSFEDGEDATIKIEGVSGVSISVDGYDVYFLDEDLEGIEGSLYRVNVKDQSQEKILDTTGELEDSALSYTLWHDGRMYIPNGDKLSVYDPAENTLSHIPLPGQYAAQVVSDKEKVYVIDCDMEHLGETEVYCLNPKTEEIEAEYHFAESVLQSYIEDGVYYMLQQDPQALVCKYELLPDGSCRKLGESLVGEKKDDNYRISDMFLSPIYR